MSESNLVASICAGEFTELLDKHSRILGWLETSPEAYLRRLDPNRFNLAGYGLADDVPLEALQDFAYSMFEDLELDCPAITIAQTEYFRHNESDGSPGQLWAVTEKVHGLNLLVALRDQTIVDEIRPMTGQLRKYVAQRYDNRQPFWFDIRHNQFVYGVTARDAVPRLYMIDADPIFDKTHLAFNLANTGIRQIGKLLRIKS